MTPVISSEDKLTYMRREERNKMRTCFDIQNEVFRIRDKSRRWHRTMIYYSQWRGHRRNQMRVDSAELCRAYWSRRLKQIWEKLTIAINKLEYLTAKRRKLQDELGIATTINEYIDHGPYAENGIRFVLLDHELDSTTSVHNYVEQSLGGSSLFMLEQ